MKQNVNQINEVLIMSEAINEFSQVVVWPGTLVGEDKSEEFEKFILENLGSRIKYIKEVKTLPDKDESGKDIPETGGRNDAFFYVHQEDISKFAVARLSYGMRWIEDALDNNPYIYPKEVKEYRTW